MYVLGIINHTQRKVPFIVENSCQVLYQPNYFWSYLRFWNESAADIHCGFLSCLECEMLIRHMLVIDPARRLSMREIITHKWMKMDGEDEEFNKLIQVRCNLCFVARSHCTVMGMRQVQGTGLTQKKTMGLGVPFQALMQCEQFHIIYSFPSHCSRSQSHAAWTCH